MFDEWREIDGGYSINQDGQVKNDFTGHILKRSFMSNHEPAVSLKIDGRLYRKQVITFMALIWMEPHEYEHFDTPIHLDGDRNNCNVDNLVFRPRWFAIAYNKDCLENLFPEWNRPFEILETKEVFSTAWECARTMGCLQEDIRRSLLQEQPLFPGGLSLKFI